MTSLTSKATGGKLMMVADDGDKIRTRFSKTCSGCGVCAVICPNRAIALDLNNEGFYEATINPKKCNDCKLCEYVCPWQRDKSSEQHLCDETMESYAAYSKSDYVRRRCSSGGVCFELASKAIARGHKACGVKYNALSGRAEHFIADNVPDYVESCGSKYLQSYTVDAFSGLFNDSTNYVVFGTPCQILALRKALILMGIQHRFILVDFFCHGVPSYYLWCYYLNMVQKRLKGLVRTVNFRDKQYGWKEYTMVIDLDKHLHVDQNSKGDLFYQFFLGNLCLNEPCYSNCSLRGTSSAADIRAGDCWAADYAGDNKGTSVCLVYTRKGKEAAEWLTDSCNLFPVPVKNLIRGQIAKGLHRPYFRSLVLRDLQKQKSPTLLRYKYVLPLRYARRARAAWRKLMRQFG